MKKHAWISCLATCGTACLVLLPVTARADVTIQRQVHFDEVTGLAAHDTTETDYIQGDKKREEDLRKFTGSVLGAWQKFRGEDNGAPSVDIYLVGDNKHYDMDPNKKTYSVDAIYDPQQQASGRGSEGGNGQAQPQKQQDEDTKVTKNEFSVKETGQKKNINGFDTAEYLLTWDVETENTKTGEKGKWLMSADLWNSTDGKLAKAQQEQMAYTQAYLKLMNLPSNPNELAEYGLDNANINGASITAADRKAFLDKLHTVKGYSVTADVRWEVAGTDKNGKSTSDSGQQGQGQGQGRPNLDNALGSLFGGNNKKSDSPPQPQSAGTPGMTTMFHSYTEVKSVGFDAIPATQFQAPADYKKDD